MFASFAIAAASAIAEAEAERQYEAKVADYINSLPEEQRYDALRAHREAQERRRRERTEERRHRELCAAIRSTRPQGLGLFW